MSDCVQNQIPNAMAVSTTRRIRRRHFWVLSTSVICRESTALAGATCTGALTQDSRLPARVHALSASRACLCQDKAIFLRAKTDLGGASKAPADRTLRAAREFLSAYLLAACAGPSDVRLSFRREPLLPRTLAPWRVPVRAACLQPLCA